jgi:sporulation protein YtfJ
LAVKPISELTDSSMKNLQTLIDSNSVVGDPITTPDGTTILPVSRVSFGFGTGGSDLPATQKELFGGGSGGGVSITPVAFLVIQNGSVKVLQIQSFSSAADRVVGMVPDVIDRVSGFVSGMGKKDAPDPETDPAPAAQA